MNRVAYVNFQKMNYRQMLTEDWEEVSAVLLMLPDAAPGRMMSANAVTRNGKVFAFCSTKGGREGLGLRIPRDVDLSAFALTDWQHLAPFKTRPPMKDWIVVGREDRDKWVPLGRLAHAQMTAPAC